MRTTVVLIVAVAALALTAMACELAESPDSGFPRPAPTFQSAPTVKPDPTIQPAPTVQAAPTFQSAPTVKPGPTIQPAPTVQAAPTYQPAPTFQPAGPAQIEVPAPVESVEIVLSGGQDSDADLVLLTGLPNACYDLGSYSVDESTTVIVVEVINLKSGGNLACAEIYLTEETHVPLERSIEPCETYEVRVNGETYEVQATEPGRPCG